MDADALKQRQQPIKTKYLRDSATAQRTLRSQGRLGTQALTCEVDTWGGVVQAGLHEACGGDGTTACSANMLLEALIGCAGVTLSAVTTAMRIDVRSASIEAEGDLDFRGTMGVDRSAPVGFQAIRVVAFLDCDADDDQLDKVAQLTERYCVVHQTLAPSLPVSFECRRVNSATG